MTDFASQPLASWQSFYVIVGSSGAALIGVQFVVITLIATLRRRTTEVRDEHHRAGSRPE